MSAESVGSLLAGLAARLTSPAPRPAGAPPAPATAAATAASPVPDNEGALLRRGARLDLRI